MADALRKKNRERAAKDHELKKKATMNMQRETEQALKVFLGACDTTFRGSGVLFDAEATSSSEDEAAVAAPAPAQVAGTLLQGDEPASSTSKERKLPIAGEAEPVPDCTSPHGRPGRCGAVNHIMEDNKLVWN